MDEKKQVGLGGHLNSDKNYEPKTVNGLMNMNGLGNGQGQQTDVKKAEEEFAKLKGKIENLKKEIVKKYKFTIGLTLLPAQTSFIFEEEEPMPPEIAKTKPLHLLLLIPEEQFKNIPKIKPDILKLVDHTKENLWLHIWTPVDLWNFGLDSKYDVLDAISAGFPFHDNGFLGALRVANIHKSLLLRKFDKYVASYVIGGSLVRGTADKTSDVDTFVIIDDTDVKRMNRLELLERLRGIAYDYIREATALAGVKNILNVQVWLLTDFWQRVKDAEPVAFTFIRDGVPLYDRGTFIPWKLLLKMGKIKPSPEAIDLYMKQGEQTDEFVKRRMMDAMVDVYWGVVTPTQAMMMLAGEAPPIPKTIVADVRKVLVDREKIMSPTDLKILERVVKMYKDYEHGTLKEVPGKEIDEILKESNDYIKRLKELRKKIESNMQKKDAEQIYGEITNLLKTILGNKSQEELTQGFEKELIKKGKVQQRSLVLLRSLAKDKQKMQQGKLEQKEVDSIKKDAVELISSLTEYAQRADLIKAEKGIMEISYNGRKAELVLFGEVNFIIEGKSIRKIEKGKFIEVSKEEFDNVFKENKGKITTTVSGELFKTLEKELGKFDISF